MSLEDSQKLKYYEKCYQDKGYDRLNKKLNKIK